MLMICIERAASARGTVVSSYRTAVVPGLEPNFVVATMRFVMVVARPAGHFMVGLEKYRLLFEKMLTRGKTTGAA